MPKNVCPNTYAQIWACALNLDFNLAKYQYFHCLLCTEEDHEMFRKLRRKFKKVMNEKMRLNVVDESDTSLISK